MKKDQDYLKGLRLFLYLKYARSTHLLRIKWWKSLITSLIRLKSLEAFVHHQLSMKAKICNSIF